MNGSECLSVLLSSCKWHPLICANYDSFLQTKLIVIIFKSTNHSMAHLDWLNKWWINKDQRVSVSLYVVSRRQLGCWVWFVAGKRPLSSHTTSGAQWRDIEYISYINYHHCHPFSPPSPCYHNVINILTDSKVYSNKFFRPLQFHLLLFLLISDT